MKNEMKKQMKRGSIAKRMMLGGAPVSGPADGLKKLQAEIINLTHFTLPKRGGMVYDICGFLLRPGDSDTRRRDDCMNMRKTKIICTLGPAVDHAETIERLIRTGMNAARFP